MKLFFCGDIMPGGVLPYQQQYISNDVLSYLKHYDLRIGTLEAAIGTNLPYDAIKMAGKQNIVYARNEDFYRVLEMKFDVVSLANNHVFDLGEDGLKNTIQLLKENNVLYCGAGLNIEEASKPAVVKIENYSIAFLGYCMYGNKWLGHVQLADDTHAGVNPLDINKVIEDIKAAKKRYDYVFVLPHWGREYQYNPMPESVIYAKQMVDAGADGIFGSHAHNIQPYLQYNHKPIFMGMGNFLFPDYYMEPPRPIWYPSSTENFQDIDKFIFYPNHIDKPCISIWRDLSRIGLAISLKIDFKSHKIGWDYTCVRLSHANILHFASRWLCIRKKVRLFLMSQFMSSNRYLFWEKIYTSKYNIVRRAFHVVVRVFKITTC